MNSLQRSIISQWNVETVEKYQFNFARLEEEKKIVEKNVKSEQVIFPDV